MREVSEAELARFQQQLQEAALSLDSREERVAAVYSGLEVGLTLLGATAVEDRLQEEVGTCCALIGQQSPHCAVIGQVGDTLRWLRLGGVKVWVLTGDKKETAVNICYASGHLQPGTRLLDLTGLPPALLPASLASHAAQTRAEDSCGLIVDGDTVAGVVASTQSTQLFVEVGQLLTLKIYISLHSPAECPLLGRGVLPPVPAAEERADQADAELPGPPRHRRHRGRRQRRLHDPGGPHRVWDHGPGGPGRRQGLRHRICQI